MVHDWESLSSYSEAGLAGRQRPASPVIVTAKLALLDASERFLKSQQKAKGRTLETEEIQVTRAAGRWLTGHHARTEVIYDRPRLVLDVLVHQADQRLGRAGS